MVCRLLVSYIAVNNSESFSGLAPGNGPVTEKALQSIAYSLIGNASQPRGCVVGCASSCGVNHSPGFDAKSVVHRDSQTLLAANVAFGGLHRDMPEKKLDLLKLASRIMAEPRT